MEAILDAVGLTVAHSLWQGVLIATWCAAMFRVQRSANRRYLTAGVGMLAIVAASIVTFFHVYVPHGVALAALPGGSGSPVPSWTLVGVLWALGTAAAFTRTAGGLGLLWIRRRSEPLAGNHWTTIARRLADKVGVRRSVVVRTSNVANSAFTAGWIHPVIVLPLSLLSAVPRDQVEAIIAHEVAHIRRHDFVINLLQHLLENLFFYHPAMWWLSRRMRAEREHCADDFVVRHLVAPVPYARALMQLEELRVTRALPVASNGGNLVKRIRNILEPKPSPESARWPVALFVALVLPVGVLACAMALEDDDGGNEPLADVVVEPVEAPTPAINGSPLLAWSGEVTDTASDVGSNLPESLIPYREMFYEAGCTHAVDPELLAAVAMIESNGDPRARSDAGAVGLMQLMPATAAQIAHERGLGLPTDRQHEEPAYSIDLAAWYLARQLHTFGGGADEADAVELAAAAYNGGPERLREHLDGHGDLSDETVSYKERVVLMWRTLRDNWSC